jgi:hypothetical protein
VVIIDTRADTPVRAWDSSPACLFKPVIGQALWEGKTDSTTKDGLSVAFAPGYDVPDRFVDDVKPDDLHRLRRIAVPIGRLLKR